MKEYIVPDDFLDAETIASAEGQGYLHEIVRCKYCTYRGEINCPQYYRRTELPDNYFCADGERR